MNIDDETAPFEARAAREISVEGRGRHVTVHAPFAGRIASGDFVRVPLADGGGLICKVTGVEYVDDRQRAHSEVALALPELGEREVAWGRVVRAIAPCPCCGFLTVRSPGGFEVCPICSWEDDGQGDVDADVVRGGPNGALSLTAARRAFAKGAPGFPYRAPRDDERPR